MSYRMKFGWFDIHDVLFYDDQERKIFEEKVQKEIGEYIRKINGKRVKGHGPLKVLSKEEKANLSYLTCDLTINPETNIVRLKGYGHRRIVMPIEMWFRRMFDEGKIVSYDAADGLVRDSDFDYSYSADDEVRQFYEECKRRLELYKKGELELPKYRQEEQMKKNC